MQVSSVWTRVPTMELPCVGGDRVTTVGTEESD